MSEIAKLLRLSAPCDKEFKCHPVTVGATAVTFATQLTERRKYLYAYNNSAVSGEVWWGDSDVVAGTGRPIPQGADVDLSMAGPVGDIYFICASGETADLRIFECA